MTVGPGNFKVIDDLCKNISACYVTGTIIQEIKKAVGSKLAVTRSLNSFEGSLDLKGQC